MPMTDAEAISDAIGKQVDLIIDGGACGAEPTTVVEFYDDIPEIARLGMGDPAPFQS
jgi:tRNA A37 threonylcarbamoyladenosine synthetase subunit TsaC/SUA5/YrdC